MCSFVVEASVRVCPFEALRVKNLEHMCKILMRLTEAGCVFSFIIKSYQEPEHVLLGERSLEVHEHCPSSISICLLSGKSLLSPAMRSRGLLFVVRLAVLD